MFYALILIHDSKLISNFIGNAECESISHDELECSDEEDNEVIDLECDERLGSRLDSRDRVKKESIDRMTELINLQKSNGEFEISSKNWIGSVLGEYLGSYTDVKSSCPKGIEINSRITALSMKILEVKMEDKKDLWDLVMQKSHKFLNAELIKVKENYENLMNQAEMFVKSK